MHGEEFEDSVNCWKERQRDWQSHHWWLIVLASVVVYFHVLFILLWVCTFICMPSRKLIYSLFYWHILTFDKVFLFIFFVVDIFALNVKYRMSEKTVSWIGYQGATHWKVHLTDVNILRNCQEKLRLTDNQWIKKNCFCSRLHCLPWWRYKFNDSILFLCWFKLLTDRIYNVRVYLIYDWSL